MTKSVPTVDGGSLRDPDGYVIRFEDRIYRGLTDKSFQLFNTIRQTGILPKLEATNKIVPSLYPLTNPSHLSVLKSQFPQTPHFIEHPKHPIITYPSEWTFSMLCDAALLHIDIQIELLRNKFSLKDATAYNVQFDGPREIFLDVCSIEPISSSVWPAFGQFCRMFLYPILLHTYKGGNTKSLFLANIDGISVQETASYLGIKCFTNLTCLIDVYLPYFLEKVIGNSARIKNSKEMIFKERHIEAQLANLHRLRKTINKLARKNKTSHNQWIEYADKNSYSKEKREEKRKFIETFLANEKPDILVDLGANTGEFSILAASHCKRVVAVDSDHDSINLLYRRTREKNLTINAVWMDVINPTPAIGFNSTERMSFFDRIKGNVVLGLALIHHLVITSGIGLPSIRDFLLRLTTNYLIVEYVGPQDTQFQSLIGFRNMTYTYYTEEYFQGVFSKKVQLLKKLKLNSNRTLFLFSKSP